MTGNRSFSLARRLSRATGQCGWRDSLHEAVVATASGRGSLGKMGDYEAVLGEVRRSDMMRGIWSSYVSASPYAEGADFEEAADSAIELARLSELDDLD